MAYKVIVPLAIIPNADGTSGDWYGYAGALVPDGLNDERCKVLAAEGHLEKTTAPKAAADSSAKA